MITEMGYSALEKWEELDLLNPRDIVFGKNRGKMLFEGKREKDERMIFTWMPFPKIIHSDVIHKERVGVLPGNGWLYFYPTSGDESITYNQGEEEYDTKLKLLQEMGVI